MSPSGKPPPAGRQEEIIPGRSAALEFEPVTRKRRKSRTGVLLSLLILLGGGAGAGWYYYGGGLMAGSDGEVPIIRAPDGPVKVRPENPGGMAIPNRDKLIYERLKGGDGMRVERLLPPPETPLPPPASIPIPAPVPKVLPKQVAKPIVDSATIPRIEPPAKTAPAPVLIEKSSPPATGVGSASLVYQVQLAAVRSEKSAAGEWKRLIKKNGDLLGDLKMNVVRVDLGVGKGVFYRLRAGPLASEAAASALCQRLSSRKIGCLAIRPGE